MLSVKGIDVSRAQEICGTVHRVSTAQRKRGDLGDCVHQVNTLQCQRHRSGMYTEETLGTVLTG